MTGECVRWLLISMQTHREETDMRTWPRLPRQLPHRCNVIILFQYCAFLKIVNNTRLVKMLPSCCSQIFPISSKYYLSHKKCCLSGELLPLLNNITCPSELFPFLKKISLMCWTSEPEHFTASRESSDQGHYQARVSISHHITHQPGTNIYFFTSVWQFFGHRRKMLLHNIWIWRKPLLKPSP